MVPIVEEWSCSTSLALYILNKLDILNSAIAFLSIEITEVTISWDLSSVICIFTPFFFLNL